MEWNNGAGSQPANKPAHAGSKKGLSFLSMRVASVALVVCVAILIALVALFISRGGDSGTQSSAVKNKQMQAVFLNGGQVYFGKITDLNSKTLSLSDIYYLRVNQTVQPNQENNGSQSTNSNDISLVKLGCELHGPEDSMVINQSQVIFWENLKDDGQVAKAVATYKQQNPNGQKCDTATQSNTNSGTTNNTNNTTNTNTNNSSTNSTTKKP